MINLPRSAKVVAVCVGVWRAGAAFTICEEGYPQEKVDYIYRDCGFKLKITDSLRGDRGVCPVLRRARTGHRG